MNKRILCIALTTVLAGCGSDDSGDDFGELDESSTGEGGDDDDSDPTVTTIETSGDPTVSTDTSVTVDPSVDTTADDDTTTDASATDTDPSGSSDESSTGVVEDDMDGDGVLDADDNCPSVENADQEDVDADDVGDWCDDELINDGVRLYVPAGQVIDLENLICFTDEVRIYGTVHVPRYVDGGLGLLGLTAGTRLIVGEGGLIEAVASGSPGGTPSPNMDVGGFQGSGNGPGCAGGPGALVANGGAGGGYGGEGGMTSPLNTYATAACDFCSEPTIAHCYGAPGAIYGTTDELDADLGSGGGAGGNSSGCTNTGGYGGAGGGAIILAAAESVRIDGTVDVTGETPPAAEDACGFRPGGGGGSGGSIVIGAPVIDGAGSLVADGGVGGEALGDFTSTWGWSGGGGGGGRVKFFGTTDGFTGTSQALGGEGGAAPAEEFSYVGLPGNDGTVGGSDEFLPEFGKIICL